MSINERVMRQVPPTTVISSLNWKASGRLMLYRLGISSVYFIADESYFRE